MADEETTFARPGRQFISISVALIIASLLLGGIAWINDTIDTKIRRQAEAVQKVHAQLNDAISQVKVNDQRLERVENEQKEIRECLKNIIDRVNEVRSDTRVIRQMLHGQTISLPGQREDKK